MNFATVGPVWFAALALTLIHTTPAMAQSTSSLLVWPIDPVIEADQRASALWIENRGASPALLQLRIFGWSQIDGRDHYAEQEDVVGTPPMIRIEPGQRQMIRLTRVNTTPPATEQAFRVVVDEIPTSETTGATETSVGIRFQMRYSIPLFAYGDGLWRKQSPDQARDPATAGRPMLSWRPSTCDGRPCIELHNQGPVHARVTSVRFETPNGSTTIAEGLYGYVLAGSVSRRPLPENVQAQGALHATVNGEAQPQAISQAP